VKLDVAAGRVTVGATTFDFPKLPPAILAIREAGGLLEYTRARLAEQRKEKRQ
jgi:hypothetical protein